VLQLANEVLDISTDGVIAGINGTFEGSNRRFAKLSGAKQI